MEEVYLNAPSSGELSPEDISWVDSCLVEDADIPEGNWDSLKDALMDIISAQADMTNSYAIIREEEEEGGSGNEMTSCETRETADPSNPIDDNDCVSLNEAPDTSKDDIDGEESNDAVSPSMSQVNPFQATYSEDADLSKLVDLGFDSGSSSYGLDPRSHDIFRVWELDNLSEEDELVKQLKKALSESSSESTPTPNSAVEWNGLKDMQGGSLDELIAGIADMFLSHD